MLRCGACCVVVLCCGMCYVVSFGVVWCGVVLYSMASYSIGYVIVLRCAMSLCEHTQPKNAILTNIDVMLCCVSCGVSRFVVLHCVMWCMAHRTPRPQSFSKKGKSH